MTSDLFQSDDHATELSAEEKRELIPSLTTRAELNEVERLKIHAARIWAMSARSLHRADLVSDRFGRELHARMFKQVWHWAGQYRKSEKNLGWEVHRLNEGVRNAFDDAQVWLQHGTYPLEESAVRLHHRLVAIHPWPNGNGRHARLVADVVVAAHRGVELTWGAASERVSPDDLRRSYIAAIHQADRGHMGPLLEFARS
ncbi:MAG: mobile mystery protein [Verrucomicrobia bacterium]|nr:mobile mystery protein [Verrucomicrobiota bacterium]